MGVTGPTFRSLENKEMEGEHASPASHMGGRLLAQPGPDDFSPH
jgi:hypothetical protein